MHILHIYKLTTKAHRIQGSQKRYEHFQKKNHIKSFWIFFETKEGLLTPTPKLHNVLIIGTKALKTKHITYTTIKPRETTNIYKLGHNQKPKNKTKNQTKPTTYIFTKAKKNKITKVSQNQS